MLDANGRLVDEVKAILDLIAEADIMLSAGHLNISEIWPLFEEARNRGVHRFLVNHPSFLVDASLDDMAQLAHEGVYLERSLCMFVAGSRFRFYEWDQLDAMIRAAGISRTILGSDLGQSGNPSPVAGFRCVIDRCLRLGYSKSEVRRMVSGNAATLMGLDEEAETSGRK